MPLTAQEYAEVLTELGLDTRERFRWFVGFVLDLAQGLEAAGIKTRADMDGFFGFVGPLVARNRLLSQIEGLRAQRNQAVAEVEAQIQELQGQAAAIDAALAAR